MPPWTGKSFLLAGQPMQPATESEHAISLQTYTLQPWLWTPTGQCLPILHGHLNSYTSVCNKLPFPILQDSVQSASCMASSSLWFMFCNCLIYETRICCWVSDTARCVKIPATELTFPRTYMVQTEKEKWHLQLCSDYLICTIECGSPDYPLYTQINECSNKKNWLLSLPRHLRKTNVFPVHLTSPHIFYSLACILHPLAFSGWHTTHTHISLTVLLTGKFHWLVLKCLIVTSSFLTMNLLPV